MTKDPVIEKERMDRMTKVRTLAGNIHHNRIIVENAHARIHELEAEIDRAESSEEVDTLALIEEAKKLGLSLAPRQLPVSLANALIGLLVELPRYGMPAPAVVPAPTMPMPSPWGKQ